MNDLKTILFRHTLEALEEYIRVRKPPICADGELERTIFCTLFRVVEDAGLEDEYYEWKGDFYD